MKVVVFVDEYNRVLIKVNLEIIVYQGGKVPDVEQQTEKNQIGL